MMRLVRLAVLFGALVSAPGAMAQSSAPDPVAPPSSASSSSPSAAEPAPAPLPSEWQGIIHLQVQAFRDHDASMALNFAAAPFHQMYADAEAFFAGIIAGGYSPIMESRSESFGPYQMLAPDVVMQDVKFIGNDQSLYEAMYMLGKEPDGWRVRAVQLIKTNGVGV